MEELIREYRVTLRMVNQARFKADKESRVLLGAAIGDLRYAIAYMALGREPGNRRAISRRSYVQREKKINPQIMAQIFRAKEGYAPQTNLQGLVDDLLATLTPVEAQAIYMIKGIGYSYGYAAKLMGYESKGSIQVLVDRALEKLQFVVRKPPNSERVILSKPVQRVMF